MDEMKEIEKCEECGEELSTTHNRITCFTKTCSKSCYKFTSQNSINEMSIEEMINILGTALCDLGFHFLNEISVREFCEKIKNKMKEG